MQSFFIGMTGIFVNRMIKKISYRKITKCVCILILQAVIALILVIVLGIYNAADLD